MPTYSYDSEYPPQSLVRLFGRESSLRDLFGGGKVADILLWRDKKLSAAILGGFTIIWILFEVAEYHFVTFLCHLLILSMLIIFIWSNAAGLINWSPPNINEIRLPESSFKYWFAKVNWFLLKFYEISSGKDLTSFFEVIVCLWILSVVGTYFSTLSLLYTVFLCLQTLPVLYERYEREVDYLATKGNRDVKKLYQKFDSTILRKIPRGPVKQKKFK